MQDVQRIASGVVLRVLGGRSLDRELAAALRSHPGISTQQRAALRDLCFGTLRWLGEIDAVLGALLERPLRDERLQALLRVALYQLAHTPAAPHAVVDHAVRACERIGLTAAKTLTNAVLRNFLRRRDALTGHARRSEVARFSCPQWWIDKLRAQYPEDYTSILGAGNAHPPLTLRVNVRRASLTGYLALLAEHGVAARTTGVSALTLDRPRPIERIPGFAEGLVSVQDAGAQLAAPMLEALPGHRVLDACAAPGGKASHLLEIADIELVALDTAMERLERVRANFSRLGLAGHIVCGDAADPAGWWDGREFERVLADVPCSASGVVRRHPDIKWLRRASDLAQFAHQQQRILDALWRVLARGGKLLYATCSLFHEENHAQVAAFLERHGDAVHLTPPGTYHCPQSAPGLWLPDEWHDGFFYALLEKR
ncbi:MAG: 16S rRNA (cytosine(967)-C(5))-methyltransferase [Betaproteobacteria bacterium RIFCSPLOWO2_02_64_14]|nr:MAG: 16S rRNA (cytosine(967)-C(5))-methyltransferase [Betaproteobacteria bacterium RIFCSPLOWO2_02_64_14]